MWGYCNGWGCVAWNGLFDGWRMMNDQTGRRCFVALFHRAVCLS